eukprot:c8265_g1_i1.p1 GENE.c8265_g1_i1~~c8265_g1_i1.p1  ORF type:complete len:517 (+),score=123.84 c8265_g1_i1:263-1813(+)
MGLGKKTAQHYDEKKRHVSLPRVSTAWTPSLSLLHAEIPLTNLEVETTLRNSFGFLMFVQFAHSLPEKQIPELMLWQDAMTLQHAPKAYRHACLSKIVRKYFTRNTLPQYIDCPQELVPQSNPEISDFDLLIPALKHCLSRLDNEAYSKFRETAFYSSYVRFLTKSQAPVKLDQFNLLRCIGRGAFGRVHAVTKKDTGQMYALKTLKKVQVVKQGLAEFVMREKNLLAKLESPFIVNLVYAFQDPGHLYMCMDMMKGGDLRYQLGTHGLMSEETVRFYGAELACGIQYLHDQGYVHRDIKPQNIMFDQDGHMRLTDMGLAIECKPGEVIHGRSGTVGYMSPEVVSMKQGSQPADWWALGVVLYEMAFGSHPFAASSKEESNAKVVSHEVVFPSRASDELKSLLRHLLTRDTSNRLGANGGIAQLKAHTFFEHIDWEAMYRRDIRPPFTPAERANVNGVYDFEEQLAGSDHHHTQNTHAIGNTEQQKFQSFDFVNPRALQEEFFRVARTYQADLFVA